MDEPGPERPAAECALGDLGKRHSGFTPVGAQPQDMPFSFVVTPLGIAQRHGNGDEALTVKIDFGFSLRYAL